MTDTELLQAYLTTGSQPAFAELVGRYIDLVYSAARRQVRDPHLAEDVTQAVFVILARNAATIRNPAMLGGWLLKTARHTSSNALRLQRRRRHHEQEAATMKLAHEQTVPDQAAMHIEGVLDEFLDRLAERDRGPLVLRYLQDKSIIDVAAALDISPPAAQKRIARALSRLKNLLARHGIVTACDALEQGLGSQVLHAAPPGLALLVSSAAAGGPGAVLAQSTAKAILWAKVKMLTLGLAGSAAMVVIAAAAVHSTPDRASAVPIALAGDPAPAANSPPTAPAAPVAAAEFPAVHLPNDAFKAVGPADEYLNEIDPDTLRTPESDPAGHIKSLIPVIPRNGVYTDTSSIAALRVYAAPVDKIRGKRVRITAWIKTSDVQECAGMEMYAYNSFGRAIARDVMICNRPIHGTTDWRQYEMVQDIPPDAAKIGFDAGLYCCGEIWMDDFQVQVVGNDVPLTDDQPWQIYSPIAEQYAAAPDPAVQHNGHAAICFRSKTAPHSGWAVYQQCIMRPDPTFLGHRIRISAWIKSSGVTGLSGLQINTYGPLDVHLTDDGQRGHRPITGTRDWQLYSAVADVPLETNTIYWSVTLNARGKLWIDMDSVKVEVADDDAPR